MSLPEATTGYMTPICGRCGIPVGRLEDITHTEWTLKVVNIDKAGIEDPPIDKITHSMGMCQKCVKMCTQFIRNKPNAFLITTDPTGQEVHSVHLLQDLEGLPTPGTLTGFDEVEHVTPEQMEAIMTHTVSYPCTTCGRIGGEEFEQLTFDSGD